MGQIYSDGVGQYYTGANKLEQTLQSDGIQFVQLLQAVIVLSGAGVVHAAQDEATTAKAKKRTDRLNTHLMAKARSNNELSYLASPVTGGGISVARFYQLFLLAHQHGHKTPQDWAGFAWSLLAMQGQRLIKEGQALVSSDDNLTELTSQAIEFAEKRLPILKALQVV